jgi:homoserine O-acetyltransferase
MPDVAQSTTCSYEITGRADAPLVVALGGISASKHVTSTPDDPAPGWWNDVVGDGRAVDTTLYRVLGVDYLDGDVGADGRPARIVSTYDQADALAQVLEEFEVERIHTLVGASYGGMVALAFAERYPDRVDQLVIIGASARAHPMSTALRAIQRRIVELGIDTGRAFDALALARALGITTYRSAAHFAERFKVRPRDVEEYLLHHGEKFARRFSPARFLALSFSADLHDIDPGQIRTPALLVAAEGDTIVPREQMVDLADRWGGECRLVDLPTQVGHDAFLAEPTAIGRIIRNALTSSVLV